MNSVSLPIYGCVNGKNGQVVGHTLVSECDLPRLEGVRLGKNNSRSGGYVCIRSQVNGAQVIELLHRFLLSAPSGMLVDHVNHDRRDNRRENLRLATEAQNQANRKLGSNNISGYKGVFWSKANKRYQAQGYRKGKAIYLGMFDCPVEAARAYDRLMVEEHGAFALLNFPAEVGA